jgi:hypothetical protein
MVFPLRISPAAYQLIGYRMKQLWLHSCSAEKYITLWAMMPCESHKLRSVPLSEPCRISENLRLDFSLHSAVLPSLLTVRSSTCGVGFCSFLVNADNDISINPFTLVYYTVYRLLCPCSATTKTALILRRILAMATPLANHPIPQRPFSAHQAPNNPGNYVDQHTHGYPKLSFFFSQCNRYVHLRRFSALAVRLLLYRQHELTVLEENLLDLEKADAQSGVPNRQRFSEDFGHLKAASSGSFPEGEQYRIYEKLKLELKEYGELPLAERVIDLG